MSPLPALAARHQYLDTERKSFTLAESFLISLCLHTVLPLGHEVKSSAIYQHLSSQPAPESVCSVEIAFACQSQTRDVCGIHAGRLLLSSAIFRISSLQRDLSDTVFLYSCVHYINFAHCTEINLRKFAV